MKKLLSREFSRDVIKGILTCLLLFVVGGVALWAQTAFRGIVLEAEAGEPSGQAIIRIDQTAAGNSHVAFGPLINTGIFTDTFITLENWTFGHWSVEIPGNGSAASVAVVSSGQAVIRAADQNYGDASLRSNRLYDMSNGGTFSFDVSLMDGNLPNSGAFIGFPFVAFTDLPVNTPSYYDDNGKGTGPQNGGYYQFFHTCKLPWQAGHARQFVNYIETVMPGEENCLEQVTIESGQLNRVELRYDGNGGWELWASNAGTFSPLKKLRQFTMQIPEIGYFHLGSHNHASIKYGGYPSANTTFDNISYPAETQSTSSYRNGQGVVKGNATKAYVSFNGYAPSTASTFSVTINGTVIPFTPHFRESRSFPAAVEVPVSVVQENSNNITVQGMTSIANLDIVLLRNNP